LIRWRHPLIGLSSPLEFLGLAEETGLIRPIGLWVLERACMDWPALRSLCNVEKPFLSVNVSATQLVGNDFVGQAIATQQQHGMPPDELKLELTETGLIEHRALAQEQLQRLCEFGNSIALDDYGTGYSGLEHLQSYRFKTLKLDQSFIREMLNSSLSFQLVMSSIDMAKSLLLDLVAEGIETEEIARILKLLGCDYGQGYLYSKPKPLAELLRLTPA
ncbi:MAG: EAL domain-containing protein, partial [Rhodoferax sp.]